MCQKKNIHLIYTYNLKQKFVSRQIHLHGKKYNKTRKEVRPLTLVTINQSKKERKNSKFITQINLYITFVTKRYVNIRFNNWHENSSKMPFKFLKNNVKINKEMKKTSQASNSSYYQSIYYYYEEFNSSNV